MNEEDRISKALVDSLSQINKFPGIGISHRQEILIGMTCGYYDRDLRLLFQSAEQDIVVYLKNDKHNYQFEGKEFFRKFPKSLTDQKILIPLVIFEVKYRTVNTHTIRQYSELARMIKLIFPFCLYNLLLIDIKRQSQNAKNIRNADKIYMAGKGFDKVIHKSDYKIDNAKHNQLVEAMCNIVETHVEYLRGEEYFELTEFLK